MSGAREPTPVSRDEGFAAWLAMNEYLVEEEFLGFDVQGMPDDPFCEHGLRVAGAEALRRFTDYHEALAAPNRELFDKFVAFLVRRSFEGLVARGPTGHTWMTAAPTLACDFRGPTTP
jgi:hypothetical protein